MITRAVLFEEFAGRSEELAYLVSFRARTGREAQGGAVVISGDSGVGKTRLLREFHRAIERERGGTASVRCDEAHAPPYAPFIDALEALATMRELRNAASLDAALKALTQAAAVTVEDAVEQRLQRHAALRTALEDAARKLGHLTLIVDDVQSSDLASLDALRGLASAAKRLPFALVLAYRSDDIESDIARSKALALIEREGVDRIVLRALPRQDLSQALRTLLPSAPVATLDRICDLSEGKPYVAEELARSIVERGGSGEIQPTLSLRSAVLGRLASLDPTSRDIVRRAAVLGTLVRIDDIITGGVAHADVVRALRSARDLQIVEEREIEGDAAFQFRHAITREILYADLLAVERHELHLAAADRLVRDDPGRLAEIAYHLDASGSTERAREASERAGDGAAAVAAFADALKLYERAIQCTGSDRPDDLHRVAEKFLVALDGTGELGDRHELIEKVSARLERSGRGIEAYALRVRTLKIFATYQSPHSAALLPRVRDRIPEGAPAALRFDASMAIFHALVLSYRFDEALRALEEAERLVPEPSPAQLGGILIAKTMLAFHWHGDPAAAEGFIQATRELARTSGNDRRFANSTKNLSAIAAERGEFAEALRYASEAGDAFARAGFARWAAKSAGLAAMFAVQLGRFVVAQRLLAATDGDSLREREWIIARAVLARAVGGGDRAGLEAALHDGIARHDTIFVRHLAAELAWSASTPDEARAIVRAALPVSPSFDTDMDMADAVAAFGDPADAQRVAEHVRGLVIADTNVLSRAGRHLIEARLAAREHRTLAAAESAREAEELYRRMGLWMQRAHAMRLCGRTDEARAFLRELGATAELARFSDGARPVTGIPNLSQREEQVARLAAAGLQAREIAERLSISPRTVETHLGKVYEKLGFRSRADLIVFFA